MKKKLERYLKHGHWVVCFLFLCLKLSVFISYAWNRWNYAEHVIEVRKLGIVLILYNLWRCCSSIANNTYIITIQQQVYDSGLWLMVLYHLVCVLKLLLVTLFETWIFQLLPSLWCKQFLTVEFIGVNMRQLHAN